MAGKYPDGVSRYAADSHDLHTYARAQDDFSALSVPVLHQRADGASRLFIAYFDGTGNDMSRPERGQTNVARLYDATKDAGRQDPGLGSHYVKGPGTQVNAIVALADGARGMSYDARLETMYFEFCRQAKQWLRENPDVRISVADVGFSRGAEQAAGFARLVAERGIRDVDNSHVVRNKDGLVVAARYPSTVLVSGQSIAQAELLFDPVGTGTPSHRDRRPPPQVLTGLQITAEDERRDLFPATRIFDPGFTHDGRFLNVNVGGCHSDVGGSYREDGLARRSYNLGVDFLNALSDRPFLRKQHLRPDLDVVHRSVEHAAFYDDDHYRANERRGLPEALRRPSVDVIGGSLRDRRNAARDAEPIDAALDARFERRAVPIGPLPPVPARFRDLPPARERDDLQPKAPPRGPAQVLIGTFAQAEAAGDRARSSDALDAYLANPHGQAFAAQVDARLQAVRDWALESPTIAAVEPPRRALG